MAREDKSCLPIGVQIVGPYFEDRTPIGFAELIEREFGHLRVTPKASERLIQWHKRKRR
jgi:Asp-tRNA(Asn)/Glu-tRNA(Gln) amidotransferase A subunit family amidase